MRKYGMKLHPTKCTFEVTGKFLAYMVIERGIDANPEKIEAILQMPNTQICEGHSEAGRKNGIP
ncbi:UNVERIFIED_CONTAM: hypothetical protein Slati_1131100 [Sesamum latifolium]|uniref:Uncharacterized protein n=1 Tax=Sesamum latifolium TaxID=2727402 RepID=A0AAW2XI12_9LAMI